ncbi:MAG: radical SAM protein [Armatimonadota bacterium]
MIKAGELSKLTTTYASYMKRSEVCSYTPTRIWVEATSNCNLQCSFCGNRQLSPDQKGNMDIGLFMKIADEAQGKIQQFNLFHRGESLLHPQIGEMVRYSKGRGIRTRIHTNGTMLTPDLARELIESGLDVISISFDGYDRAMYEANRPGAGYDRVFNNIINLLKIKKELQSQKPFAAIELMEIADYSKDEMMKKRKEFLSSFDGLPLDKFIIRKPHNWGGLIEMEQSKRDNPKRIPCPLLWHALIVLWDGTVLPCPQDFFGILKLGNVNDESLLDIWNNDAIRALRREMADPKSLTRKPCTECDRIIRATIAGVPVDYLGRFISETVLGNSWLGKILPH